MTQQQREIAAKWLHTRRFNEIEPFRRLLFVLSHEINNRRPLVVSYVTERHACESHTTIKMLALSVLERYKNKVIIKFAFIRLIKEYSICLKLARLTSHLDTENVIKKTSLY